MNRELLKNTEYDKSYLDELSIDALKIILNQNQVKLSFDRIIFGDDSNLEEENLSLVLDVLYALEKKGEKIIEKMIDEYKELGIEWERSDHNGGYGQYEISKKREQIFKILASFGIDLNQFL